MTINYIRVDSLLPYHFPIRLSYPLFLSPIQSMYGNWSRNFHNDGHWHMPYSVTWKQIALCLVNFRVPNNFFYCPVILACTVLLTHLPLPDFASLVPTSYLAWICVTLVVVVSLCQVLDYFYPLPEPWVDRDRLLNTLGMFYFIFFF